MKSLFSRFLKDESGATAIEYGLIAAGIAVVIITAVNALGTQLNATFEKCHHRYRSKRKPSAFAIVKGPGMPGPFLFLLPFFFAQPRSCRDLPCPRRILRPMMSQRNERSKPFAWHSPSPSLPSQPELSLYGHDLSHFQNVHIGRLRSDSITDYAVEEIGTGISMALDVARLLLFPALMAFAAASDLLTMTISN